jgi:hypothetical protein
MGFKVTKNIRFGAKPKLFFDRDQNNFHQDQISFLTRAKLCLTETEKNSTETKQIEDDVEGAKPPDEVERSETSGERSEPALCKS